MLLSCAWVLGPLVRGCCHAGLEAGPRLRSGLSGLRLRRLGLCATRNLDQLRLGAGHVLEQSLEVDSVQRLLLDQQFADLDQLVLVSSQDLLGAVVSLI